MNFIDPSGLKTIALRATIQGLGGKVTWNNKTKTATVYLDGQSTVVYAGDKNGSYARNGRLYTDDAWLFAMLATTFDLGKGWTGRIERHGSGDGYQKHVHIYKGKKAWSQNEDGSPHDDNNNSSGSPPSSVTKNLKNKKGWDWEKKEKGWLDKIEIRNVDGMYDYITYPNGRKVTVYHPPGSISISANIPLSNQQLKDYYYGPTYINAGIVPGATVPVAPGSGHIPIPGTVPIPVLA